MNNIPLLIIMAPLLLPCMSERQDFPLSNNATWDKAREHCQVCYKELVTVGYDNSLILALAVTQTHWIGLREQLATGDPWSRWANEDPLAFQNWYPGKRQSVAETTTTTTIVTTIPEITTNGFTQTDYNYSAPETSTDGFTQTDYNYSAPETSTDGQTTVQTTVFDAPKTTPYDYVVAEVCVAMLSSGTWVETDCSAELPYICYDDRFYGNASVTMNATSATVSWLAAPGNISSYRVEVREGANLTQSVDSGLTYRFNTTPGTLYTARVFPVKCGRDLDSQNVSFFTRPEVPLNLVDGNATESSVDVSWDRPGANLHHYLVEVRGGRSYETFEERMEVAGLMPGSRYSLDVFAALEDRSVRSDPANITVFTKPSIVSGVTVSEVTNHSLLLSWTHSGNATGYLVVAKDTDNLVLFNGSVNGSDRSVPVTEIPAGTQLRLTVRALADYLQGEGVTVVHFVSPNAVPSMQLNPTGDSIGASWPRPPGAFEVFRVSVQLQNSTDTTTDSTDTTNTTSLKLDRLYAAAKYKVTIVTVAGNLTSLPLAECVYTTPVKPDTLTISSSNKSHVTLIWTTPGVAAATEYLVKYNANFWSHSGNASVVDGKNSLTVDGLHSGTLYMFNVQTVSGVLKSSAASVEKYTDGDPSGITLSMLCSSAESLFCDHESTKTTVLKKLDDHFGLLLNGVSWKLDWKKR